MRNDLPKPLAVLNELNVIVVYNLRPTLPLPSVCAKTGVLQGVYLFPALFLPPPSGNMRDCNMVVCLKKHRYKKYSDLVHPLFYKDGYLSSISQKHRKRIRDCQSEQGTCHKAFRTLFAHTHMATRAEHDPATSLRHPLPLQSVPRTLDPRFPPHCSVSAPVQKKKLLP